jgi:hypothetical protein
MIRPFVCLALAAGLVNASLASTAAVAAQPLVNEAFGNTIVSTYPDGRTGRLWLKADGTYTAQGRRHDPSSGHWKVSGAKLCLKQSKPMAVPIRFCTPIPETGMGHAWAAKAVTGEDIRVQMVKGRG